MPGLARLDRAEKKELQRALRENGAYRGAIDGIFGEASQQALRRFQEKHGLDTKGVTRQTVQALGVDFAKASQRGEAAKEQGSEPTRERGKMTRGEMDRDEAQMRQRVSGAKGAVDLSALDEAQARTLQEELQTLGFYQGDIDGLPGARTQRALQRFYRKQAQLAAQGRILPESAEALGLSSAAIERVRGQERGRPQHMQGEPQRSEP